MSTTAAVIQGSLLPGFAVVGDELALSFDDALNNHRASGASLSEAQASSLEALDAYSGELSGHHNEAFWCDPTALATDPRWQGICDLARIALEAFGWVPDVRSRDGGIYVAKDQTVRNT